MGMTARPNKREADPYSEEGLNPCPDIDPYVQAEAEAAAAQRAEEDELAMEAHRQNALLDATRSGGVRQIGTILPEVLRKQGIQPDGDKQQ